MNKFKTLHRIYFGFDGKPDPYKGYLETWKTQLPEYEIKHWNASNLPMDINDYVKSLYEIKDAIFLGDFFRWWILKEYGGIYLDADIEVVNGRKFNVLIEELEKSSDYDAMIGVEKIDWGYTAHAMACKKNAGIASFICELYENMGKFYYWRKDFLAPRIPQLYFYDKKAVSSPRGAVEGISFSEPIVLERVKIYPQDYFSPLGYGSPPFLEANTDNVCLCHHFGGSWVDDKHEAFLNKQRIEKRNKMYAEYLAEEEALLAEEETLLIEEKALLAEKKALLTKKEVFTEKSLSPFSLPKFIKRKTLSLIRRMLGVQKAIDIVNANFSKTVQLIEESNRRTFIVLKNFFKVKKKIFYIGTPEHPNLGDHAIAYASVDLLRDLYPQHFLIELSSEEYWSIENHITKIIAPDDLIFLHGGGNMGNIYIHEEELRRSVFRNFPDNKIVSMPQSVTFLNNTKRRKELQTSQKIYGTVQNLLLFARDEKSLLSIKEYFPLNHHELMPDSVLYWESYYAKLFKDVKKEGVLFVFRTDEEKILNENLPSLLKKYCSSRGISWLERDTRAPFLDTLSDLKKEIRSCLYSFAESKLVITDRYHGVIFSVLTGTPCLAFKSRDHKISEGIKWFKHLPWVHYVDDESDLFSLIKKYVKDEVKIERPLVFTEEIINKYRKLIEKYGLQ